jgi:hypothetical protein
MSLTRIFQLVARGLRSRRFAYITLGFFVFEGLWIACSAVYPMAFDEEFHFGLIKLYSHHWLPFLTQQPENTSQFGAVTSDPSYLYHYLMSFPYRFLELFVHNQTAQIIMLRFINVGLFAVGLLLFYRLLRRVGSSRLLANGTLAMFALIPIVPLLAAHINYDNLLFPLMAWVCLLVLRINGRLAARKIDLRSLATLVIVTMLSCLVKYAFLPIALAAALFLTVQALRAFRGHGRELRTAASQSYRVISGRVRLVLLGLLVASGVLFAQRYVFNLAAYHTPLPDCDAVLSVDECMSYGPWARNYHYKQQKDVNFDDSALGYTWQWVQGMHYRMFFMITGPGATYTNYQPMPLPSAAALILAVSGTVAVAFYWRQIFAGRSNLVFLLFAAVLYIAVLWLTNYKDFVSTGRPVAINGRYLLLVLFPLAAVYGRALAIALRQWTALRLAVITMALLCFLQGGGVISFIVRSDARWDWNSPLVVHTNNAARQLLEPVTIEGDKYY